MEVMMLMMAPADKMGLSAPSDVVADIAGFAMGLAKRGKLKEGHQLSGLEGGFRVERSSGGLSLSDGPFAETKELIGGYFILEVDSLEEAQTYAKANPHLSIGPVVVMPLLPSAEHSDSAASDDSESGDGAASCFKDGDGG